MSFRVFAAGSGNFHYVRDNNPDMDVFNAADIASALRASGPSPMGVVEGVTEYAMPNSYLTGISAIAKAEFLHMMKNAVNFLAMRGGASDGWISVSTRESNIWPWPDTASFARYNFQPGDDPGTEFYRTIRPALEATDMNDWGVVRVLALVLSRYDSRLDDSSTPMINIQLSK